MKTALVHDWLTGIRGGERCLKAFLDIYPQADIYTLLHIPGSTYPEVDARVKYESFIGKLPRAARLYRHYLPLYPLAARSFDFSGYDLVVSLSHAAVKNVRVPKGVPHICYCFSPMRYIWDQAREYFGAATPLLWPVIAALRSWDRSGTRRVSDIIGISRFVAQRIKFTSGRSAEVIYPPVDTSWIKPISRYSPGQAFLYAGALVPYKRVDVAIEAFNSLGLKLWVVGNGPDESRLRAMAKSNIEFFGRVSDARLVDFYRNCRALIFPGTEDFGMIPVECMASGRPVIGVDAGGLAETVTSATGLLYPAGGADQAADLARAVQDFCAREADFAPQACVERAAEFSLMRFKRAWGDFLASKGFPVPGEPRYQLASS